VKTVTAVPLFLFDPRFFLTLVIIGVFIGGQYLKRQWKIETLDSIKLSVFIAFGFYFFGFLGMVFSLLLGVLALHHFQKSR
jgi:hypothetical protein